MKLNIDCCRDILLLVESCEYNQILRFEDMQRELSKYADDELQYCSYKMYEAGYISVNKTDYCNYASPVIHWINNLTFSGHQFLEKIRDDDRWGKIKKGASSVRDYSLSAISAIAEGMTAAAISAWASSQIPR